MQIMGESEGDKESPKFIVLRDISLLFKSHCTFLLIFLLPPFFIIYYQLSYYKAFGV